MNYEGRSCRRVWRGAGTLTGGETLHQGSALTRVVAPLFGTCTRPLRAFTWLPGKLPQNRTGSLRAPALSAW
jgi:hypothetical protein